MSGSSRLKKPDARLMTTGIHPTKAMGDLRQADGHFTNPMRCLRQADGHLTSRSSHRSEKMANLRQPISHRREAMDNLMQAISHLSKAASHRSEADFNFAKPGGIKTSPQMTRIFADRILAGAGLDRVAWFIFHMRRLVIVVGHAAFCLQDAAPQGNVG